MLEYPVRWKWAGRHCRLANLLWNWLYRSPFLDSTQITSFFVRTPDRRLYPNKDGVVYVNTGENVSIECKAIGRFVFLFCGKTMQFKRGSESQTQTVLLNITRANGKNNGSYTCLAFNMLFKPPVARKKFYLFVETAAIITFFDLVTFENDKMKGCRKVAAGEQQTVECKADGEPAPVVVILDERGEQVSSGSRKAFYSFSPEKKETYKCWAKNNATKGAAKASLLLCPSSSKPSSFSKIAQAATATSHYFI